MRRADILRRTYPFALAIAVIVAVERVASLGTGGLAAAASLLLVAIALARPVERRLRLNPAEDDGDTWARPHDELTDARLRRVRLDSGVALTRRHVLR